MKPELREHLIAITVVASLSVAIYFTGYSIGHCGMNDANIRMQSDQKKLDHWEENSILEGWFNHDDPIHVNVECHNDASDWATIRMANEMAEKYDIPAYIHGSCLTHNVVDVPIYEGVTCEGGILKTTHSGEYLGRCGNLSLTTTGGDGTNHAIVNDPQPEGK